VKKVGCYDRKISDIRNDFSHKTSYTLADAPVSLLVFEGVAYQEHDGFCQRDWSKSRVKHPPEVRTQQVHPQRMLGKDQNIHAVQRTQEEKANH